MASEPGFSQDEPPRLRIVSTAQGWLPMDATPGQIDFGVEIVSTGGTSARYEVNDFSIDTN